MRPFVDPSICEATTRWGGELAGEADGLKWSLFSRPSSGPIAIQIIADPELGPTGPYAMVLRYVDRWADVENRETEPIGEFAVALDVVPNGNAHAHWNLDDGGEGYVRSRGLERDTVVGIIERLSVRHDGDDRPGFDYAPTTGTSTGGDLLHEGIWAPSASGSYAGIECTSPDGEAIYRIAATHGAADPIVEYAFVSDRPAPIEVGYQQGSMIVINGPSGRSDAPTVSDVRNADDETWTSIPTAD